MNAPNSVKQNVIICQRDGESHGTCILAVLHWRTVKKKIKYTWLAGAKMRLASFEHRTCESGQNR